jgi:outer membrane receptor protein involved in Fe transport
VPIRIICTAIRIGACLAAILGAGSAAFGQTQPAVQAAASGGDLEEVVVTGTLIQRSGYSMPTPTTVMSSQDIALTSASDVGDLVYDLPQFQPSKTPTSSTTNNLNVGQNNFDLRGLGTVRTLTLVDGMRRVPNGIDGSLDTNVIPAGIIDRVEVVTGGASAAYGSDAIAGVVNVILRKDIDGFEGSVQGGESFHGDDREYKGTLNFGTKFAGDRGHFLIATEASNNDGAGFANQARDWARPNWGVVYNPAYAPGNGQYAELITANARNGNLSTGGLITSGPLAGTEFLPGGVPAAFNPGQYPPGSDSTIGGDGPAESIRLAIPLKRETVYTRVQYDINDNIDAFVVGSYSDETGNGSQMSYTDNNGAYAIPISIDNAYLPAATRNAMLADGITSFNLQRLNTDFGYWGAITYNRSYELVAGLEGRFGEHWTWKAYYSSGSNTETQHEQNDEIVSHMFLAADAVLNPANGQIVCRSTLTNPGNGCVPINLFGYGSPSPQAIGYVTDHQVNVIKYSQNVADATIQGQPFSNWAGPVSVAAGASLRHESVDQDSDPVSEAQDHLFDNYIAQSGSFSVKEGFAETVVPLLAKLPMAKELDLNGAVRFTDHSQSGNSVTWKGGLTYDLTDEWRLRVTRSLDIRSPNLSELFFTPLQYVVNVTDVHGAVVQVNNPQPGNANLKPEKAQTWTGGFVYKPSWTGAGTLQLSTDYYRISMNGRIAVLDPQYVVDGCASGSAYFCTFLPRDAKGNLTAVITPPLNSGQSLTNGFDFEADYGIPASSILSGLNGTLTLRALATRAFHNNTTLEGVVSEAVGSTIPHWRANTSASYSTHQWTFHLAGNYVGGVVYNNAYAADQINQREFSGRLYLNAAVQYEVPTTTGRIQLFADVDNVFDRDPPIIPGTVIYYGQEVTRPALYDQIGRQFTVGVRVKF